MFITMFFLVMFCSISLLLAMGLYHDYKLTVWRRIDQFEQSDLIRELTKIEAMERMP